MNVNHSLVFDELIVAAYGHSFRVNAQDRVTYATKFVSTIGKRDLRDQQNDEDDENY